MTVVGGDNATDGAARLARDTDEPGSDGGGNAWALQGDWKRMDSTTGPIIPHDFVLVTDRMLLTSDLVALRSTLTLSKRSVPAFHHSE